MAHKVELEKLAVSWDDWIATKDISVLADYPQCAGMTLEQVVDQGVEELVTFLKSHGLVSHETNPETGIVEMVWESEDHHTASSGLLTHASITGPGVKMVNDDGVDIVDADGNSLYYTPLGYLQYLHSKETQ